MNIFDIDTGNKFSIFEVPAIDKHKSIDEDFKEPKQPQKIILNDFNDFKDPINSDEKNSVNEFSLFEEENNYLRLLKFDDEERAPVKQNDLKQVKLPKHKRKPRARRLKRKVVHAFLQVEAHLIKQVPESLPEDMKEFPFFEQIELDPHSIYCKICLQKSSDYQDLPCNHKFCLECYKMFCLSLVDSCKIMVDELKCPDCEELFNDKLFMRYFSIEEIKRIHDLRYKIKGQALVAQKKAFPCPVPDCPGYAHLLQYEKITACCKCKCSLCTACGLSAHPNMTCEENSKESLDEEFQKLIFSQNWKKCPTCGVPVEKIDGCQFLYCSSTICKGRNFLCNLCGRFVIMAQHYTHYKSKGPYGNTCNTLEGIPENIDPSRLVPILGDEEQDDSEYDDYDESEEDED